MSSPHTPQNIDAAPTNSHKSEAHSQAGGTQLDALDEQLIRLLEEDGRMSYADIGARVALTPGGARIRVMRLQERGIIRIVGAINPKSVGLSSSAALHIEVNGDIDKVADQISQCDGVRYIVLGSGRYSIFVEVYAVSPGALFSLVNREIRSIPGVKSLETFTHNSVHTSRPVFPPV